MDRPVRSRDPGDVWVCPWVRPLYSLMVDLCSDMTRPAEVGMEPGDGASHRGYH